MAERDNARQQSAAGGRVEIAAEPCEDHHPMTARQFRESWSSSSSSSSSSRGTQRRAGGRERIDWPQTTITTLNYAQRRGITLSRHILAWSRHGQCVRRKCALELLVIIVIELVLASAGTGNAQAHPEQHTSPGLIRSDRARSIGGSATTTTIAANVRGGQHDGYEQRPARAELLGFNDRGRGTEDKIDHDQAEAETIGRVERSNYLDVNGRVNGRGENNHGARNGGSSSHNNNDRGAPVCNDCLALQLVALVEERQINGCILRPAAAKLHAPASYGSGPIGQVDGATPAIRDEHGLQSSDNSHNNNNNNNNNGYDDYYNNGRFRMGNPENRQGQAGSLGHVSSTHDYSQPSQRSYKQDYYQQRPPAFRPFEPKSDEHCPMEGPVTVCDQIGRYPTQAVVSKIQGLERALYKMHFNVDSLFSDERDNLSEPFESMALMTAPGDNTTRLTFPTRMNSNGSREFATDLNPKYSRDVADLSYQMDPKSATGRREGQTTRTDPPPLGESGNNNSNHPASKKIVAQFSSPRSDAGHFRNQSGGETPLGTLATSRRLAHPSNLEGQVGRVVTYEPALRDTKYMEQVQDVSDSRTRLGASSSEGGTQGREEGEIWAGERAADAWGHGGGGPAGASFGDGDGGHKAPGPTANSRQSHKPKHQRRQRWRRQLDIKASNERIGAAPASPLATPASARLSSVTTTRGGPFARSHGSVNDDHGYDALDDAPTPRKLDLTQASGAAGDHPAENNQSPNDNAPVWRRTGNKPRDGPQADVATERISPERGLAMSAASCSPVSNRDGDENLAMASETLMAGPVASRVQKRNLLSPMMLVSALSSGHEARRQIELESSKAPLLLDIPPSETIQRQQSHGTQFVTGSPSRLARDELSNRVGISTKTHTTLKAHDESRPGSNGLARHGRQVSNTENDPAAVNNDGGERASNTNTNLSDLPPPSDESSEQGSAPQPICRARSIYISPRAAMNDKKQWKYVVNAPERDPRIKQIIRVDICESPFEPCSGDVTLPLGYTSQCKQKYAKKKLLALDSQTGLLEVDSFFIPSCCICQLVPDTS